LEDLTRIRAHQQRIRVIPHPLVPGRRHFQRKQPVVGDEIFGRPVCAGQSLSIGPVMRRPTMRLLNALISLRALVGLPRSVWRTSLMGARRVLRRTVFFMRRLGNCGATLIDLAMISIATKPKKSRHKKRPGAPRTQ
jgi:hypothetical protein